MRVTNYSETGLKLTVSVWEQRQYDTPLAGRQAIQGRERQPYVAARSIWEAAFCKKYATILSLINFFTYFRKFF